MKPDHLAQVLILAIAGALTSCADAELDFSDHELDNTVQVPGDARRFINGTPYVYLRCNQELTLTIDNVSGFIGLLTLKSLKYPQDFNTPPNRGDFNCDIEVTITRIKDATAIQGTYTHRLKPGETLTSIFLLENANKVELKLKCTGNLNHCLLFDPELRTGKVIPKARKRWVNLAEFNSNPNGLREFTPTNAGGGNRCNTQETDIHHINIDFDYKKLKTSITVIARSLCDCEKFIAKAYHESKTYESTSAGNRLEGGEATITEIKSNESIRITGRCEGPANGNAVCNGDAIIYFGRKGK